MPFEFPDFRHDVIICPRCGKEMDASLAITNDHRPDPGDVSICLYCAGVSLYDDGLRLRLPTAAESLELRADPRIQKAIWAVKEVDADG